MKNVYRLKISKKELAVLMENIDYMADWKYQDYDSAVILRRILKQLGGQLAISVLMKA